MNNSERLSKLIEHLVSEQAKTDAYIDKLLNTIEIYMGDDTQYRLMRRVIDEGKKLQIARLDRETWNKSNEEPSEELICVTKESINFYVQAIDVSKRCGRCINSHLVIPVQELPSRICDVLHTTVNNRSGCNKWEYNGK
jgi:hypothetical protein